MRHPAILYVNKTLLVFALARDTSLQATVKRLQKFQVCLSKAIKLPGLTGRGDSTKSYFLCQKMKLPY